MPSFSVNYNPARSGDGMDPHSMGPHLPAGTGAPRHSLQRSAALLLAVLLAAAPSLAWASSAEARRQMEFGVDMALKGSWREAAFRFRKAVENDPENPFAHSNLGVALESVGRFDEATAAYEKALALAPGDDKIMENLQRLKAYLATVQNTGYVASSEEEGGKDDDGATDGGTSEPPPGGGGHDGP